MPTRLPFAHRLPRTAAIALTRVLQFRLPE